MFRSNIQGRELYKGNPKRRVEGENIKDKKPNYPAKKEEEGEE